MKRIFPDLPAEDEHPKDDPARWVSALVDGDESVFAGQQASRAHAPWRLPEEAERFRQTWHSYHLIGDVMRSEELAQTAQHDRAFLQALRLRLDQEATLLAPAATPAVAAPTPLAESLQVVRQPGAAAVANRSAPRWAMTAAAVAGVAGVALVASSLFLDQRGISGPAVADISGSALPGTTVISSQVGARVGNSFVPPAAVAPSQPGMVMAGSDGVIRDRRLEEFLRAHQATRGGISAAMPVGVLRRVEVVMPASATGQ